ncbi:hypothetical protein [Pseudomonas sp. O230]|uniref:hypothetical protein n=1 Tax=Pseudomonas sp. O230 TaxID=3159450 RepID=UPI00387AC25D
MEVEIEIEIEPTYVDFQFIHKTSYFNRLAALAFRKLLIFKGLHPTAIKGPVLGCGTAFLFQLAATTPQFGRVI